MSPAWRSAPAVLGLLGGLTLLLLCPPAVRGDCGTPPVIPNAQPAVGGLTSFPQNSTVTYKCNKGFFKVPDKPDTVLCLQSNKWSQIKEFCNRSCNAPIRLRFASLKTPYIEQSYFPVGSTVEYDCRSGYKRNHTLSGSLTCLPDLTWSKPAEFCNKKSCPNPGEIKNGHVNITTNILFGSQIFFSCDKGYKLVGLPSSFCSAEGSNVGWNNPLPKCEQPPKIDNGKIQDQQPNYVNGQYVTYTCAEGFFQMRESSLQCITNDDQGEWSGQLPVCKESPPTIKVPPTPQKPTTIKAPVTEVPPTPQKPITVNAPATEAPTPQKPTTVNVPGTKVPPAPQKPTTANAPATEAPPAPQKPTTVNPPATEAPPTPQKPTTVNPPATEAPPTPQKPTTVKVPATEAPPTPQKPTTVNPPATESPPGPQKPTTVNPPATESPPTPQKPTTVNPPATEAPPTPQKPTTVKVPATEAPPTPQKPTTVNVPGTKAPPAPQKPTTANASVTKVPGTAQKNPISKTLSTETPSAALNPVTANTSATQAKPTNQRFTITKASFTHGLPATPKSTTVHAPVTKSFHTTQRVTSSHIKATKGLAVPRATTRSRATSISKGRGPLPSGAIILTSGFVAGIITIGCLILVKIFCDYGKSGFYNTYENNNDVSSTVTRDDSELRLSDKL